MKEAEGGEVLFILFNEKDPLVDHHKVHMS